MGTRKARHGFSLVEVVIAVGVLAVAIVGIIALLPATTRQMVDASDSLAAQRLPAAIETELKRLEGGGLLGAVAALIKSQGATSTLTMVAPRDGREVREIGTSTLDPVDQYFAIELWQFPTGSSAVYDGSTGAVLAAQVRVSWPFHSRNQQGMAVETNISDRNAITFAVAIQR
ncbi:MAG TPA: prepilin-type N-terminal cleavage/methylation domain-containing protein [Opitutus sp.]|nr:prepilin-type N-terminal cleavage/methylation domain-containing protein [Opitutus sp.]